MSGTRRDGAGAARRRWAVAWLGFSAVCVAAVSYFVAVFVPHERAMAVEGWRGRLSAMADDRKAAITAWLGERRGDAEVVAAYPTVGVLLAGPTAVPSSLPPWELPEQYLQGLLDSVRAAYGYNGIYVIDATGHVAAASTAAAPLEESCRQIDREVVHTGRARLDFQAHADGSPMLAIAAPVRVNGRTAGTVLLSADPDRWLYAFLRSEPTPSATGESLLARQVGEQIEFLSPLRHSSAPPLSFRVSSKTSHLAAASATRGEEMFARYVDYRGVRALGVTRWLPDPGWGLVVKVDEDEALAGFRRGVSQATLAIAGLLLAVTGLAFGAQRAGVARYRRELGESEARFALLRDYANDAILFASRDGVILDVNRRAEQLYVRRREELLGLPLDELRVPEERAALRDRLDALARDEELVFEAVHRRHDGSRFPVEVSIRVMELGKQEVFLSIVRDITERKRAEEALREAEERFRIASETSNDVVYEWDLKQSVQWFGNIDEMLGHGPGEFPRTLDGWAASVHSEDLERVTAAVRAHLEKQVPYALEYRVRKKDGTYRWWTARGAATRTPDGRPVRWIGTITDITERKRVEEALRESEDRFKYVFEHSILGMSLTRPAGEIQVNRAFAEMLGHSLAEMTGKRWQEISHPDDVADTQRLIDSVVSGEREFARFTKRYIHKNGSVVWADVATSVRRDQTGAPLYLMTSVSDITERKRAEEALKASEALLEAAVNILPVGLWIIDAEGKIVVSSAAAQRIWAGVRYVGIDQLGEYKGWRTDSGKLIEAHEWAGARALDKGETTIEEEVEIECFDGTHKIILDSALPLRKSDGSIGGAVTINQDITERRRAEEEIRRLNAELEERVRQRTAQLEAANKELEAFSYSVSHDLRAPLRAIDGFARIVVDDYADRLDDEGKRQLGVIHANAKKMSQLIDDLLVFSRLGRATMRNDAVDMRALAASVFQESTAGDADRAEFSLGELPPAPGDAAMLQQVWVNLFANALKFCPPGQKPRIEVSGHAEEAELVYTVRDHGVGFDMRYVDKLFGVFQRLHSEREFPGTGVGLALVQRIVRRHGGRVWGEGKIGEGAAFSFALPAKPTEV